MKRCKKIKIQNNRRTSTNHLATPLCFAPALNRVHPRACLTCQQRGSRLPCPALSFSISPASPCGLTIRAWPGACFWPAISAFPFRRTDGHVGRLSGRRGIGASNIVSSARTDWGRCIIWSHAGKGRKGRKNRRWKVEGDGWWNMIHDVTPMIELSSREGGEMFLPCPA